MALQEKQTPTEKPSCVSATLLPVEKDICFYVALMEMVAQSKAKKTTPDVVKAFQRTTVPNRHLVIWEKWQKADEKQKYLSSCRPLSDKQKKAFLMVPEFCKIDEKDANE